MYKSNLEALKAAAALEVLEAIEAAPVEAPDTKCEKMADYISRDDVLRKFIEGDGHDDDRFTEGYNFAVQEYREKVKNMPAADVQPVKRGKWFHINNDSFIYCSECNHEAYWDTDYGQQLFDFCPYCGAKMLKE